MKRIATMAAALVLPLYVSVLGGAGCTGEVAGQLATLSGAYLGDVVTVVVTGCLQDALGIEADGSTEDHAHEDEHSHDAEPLHEHEH